VVSGKWCAISAFLTTHHSRLTTHQRIEPLANLLQIGSSDLLQDLAVAQEYERRPQLDSKRPTQRPTRAILNLQVPDIRELFEQRRQLRL
jgi:hypothetical protein